MVGVMDISPNALKVGPGVLPEPGPGARQRVDPGPQVKANPSGAAERAAKASRGRPPGGPTAPAKTLDQAIRTLTADGRLPPRGSLLDLRA